MIGYRHQENMKLLFFHSTSVHDGKYKKCANIVPSVVRKQKKMLIFFSAILDISVMNPRIRDLVKFPTCLRFDKSKNMVMA